MAELAALGAAAALAAMLFASRLPPGPVFLLPRRGGYSLYEAAWKLFGAPYGRALYSALVGLLLLVCAAALALALRRAHPRRLPAGWTAKAGLAAGPLFAIFLAARALGHVLDLTALVWFPYGSLNVREPAAVFALGALVLVPAAAAARAWAAGRRRRATILLLALAGLDVGGALFAAAKGVGRELEIPPAQGRTLYVVLTQGPNGPGRDLYSLTPDVFNDPDPRPALRAVASGPRDARILPALRELYESQEKRWDVAGLRDALLLGAARGDTLAASLLLPHLASAAPSSEALAALGALADERFWRVGPLAAAEVSRAYAHLGDKAAAAVWAARSGGPTGVALGLLGPGEDETLKNGRISGTLRVLAPIPARVALYRRADADAPYMLEASGLVASAEPDAKGRFAFAELTAGRYSLAIALPAGDSGRGEAEISGNRGDLILTAARPSLVLSPLTIKFRPLDR